MEDKYEREPIEMKWNVKKPLIPSKNKHNDNTWKAKIDYYSTCSKDEVNLKELIDFYNENNVEQQIYLPIKICFSLYGLITKYQEKELKGLSFKVTQQAKDSLELFMFLIQSDQNFQDCVETMNVSTVVNELQLNAHLADEDSNRLCCISLIIFLSQNFVKFSNWREYIKSKHHFLIEDFIKKENLNDVPTGRHSGDHYLPTEGLFYDLDVETILSTFNTDLTNGLNTNDVENRRAKYGENTLPKPPKVNVFKMLWKQITDFIVMILIVGTIISFALEEWAAGGALTLVILFNVIIGFTQEFKAERALEALQNAVVPHATVIREGVEDVVTADSLVPGDVVILEEGNNVPADLRLCKTMNLEIVEALLTGEMNPIEKNTDTIKTPNVPIGDRKNVAFMSTGVVKGRGVGVVVATGKETEIGKISSELNKQIDKTMPLKRKLGKLGKWLVFLAIGLCLVVVAIQIIWIFIKNGTITKEDIVSIIKIGLSLAVSVVPEGLVAVVTITMALGVKRMSEKDVIIRNLPVVEGLGSVTTICTDKTGTLTMGKMTMTEIIVGQESYYFKSVNGIMRMEDSLGNETKEFSKEIENGLKVCACCNNSNKKEKEDGTGFEMVGDPTEIALYVAAECVGITKQTFEESGNSFITEVPFDSERKRMSSCYKLSTGEGIVFSKGACESILSVCNGLYNDSKLDEITLKDLETQLSNMAESGSRVLALAYKIIPENELEEVTKQNELIEKDLKFIGLVGIVDPPRNESSLAVKSLKEAGIQVRMITGDHPKTAGAIAKQIGIIQDDNVDQYVMTGSELFSISEKNLSQRDPFPCVFARVSPEDKLKVVKALKRRGEVVAMTGDGVNDAPAIKSANIGIAMGSGTDLTKQSADIILLNDNFYNIVDTIREGRRVYDNILKFVMYLLSVNSAEIWTMLICVAVGQPPIFSAMMILWANLVVDIPPSISLGLDPPSSNLMTRKPRDPNSSIFNWKKTLIVLFQGLWMSALIIGLYFFGIYVLDYKAPEDINDEEPNEARTLAFLALALIQLIHAFISKSITDLTISKDTFNNYWLIGGIIVSVLFLVGGMYIPGLNDLVSQYPIGWLDWLMSLVVIILHFIGCEVVKVIIRFSRKKQEYLLFHDDI